MIQNKKRRSSILKKKTTTEEDTTTETKARRISFSEKKFIKEFIAGEEAATIWGTSYEESADDLHVKSFESGLVDVHAKRIILRNRRVIVEPVKKKKKKIFIAENDKENVCAQSTIPPVEVPYEEKKPVLVPEAKQPANLLKIDLPLGKSHGDSRKTIQPNKIVSGRNSIGSSTFDFINISDQINKTITFEQSVDVTLSELELKMFKFRVPVTCTDMNPNMNVNRHSDDLSLNNSSQSILMFEEDVNICKMIGGNKLNITTISQEMGEENLTKTQAIKSLRDADISAEYVKESEPNSNRVVSLSMGITQSYDAKGSKRKVERKPQSFDLDSFKPENDSPRHKKPMHSLDSHSMEAKNEAFQNSIEKEYKKRSVAIDETISSHEAETKKRPTIYFDSMPVEESTVGINTFNVTNPKCHTINDNDLIREKTVNPTATTSCLVDGDQVDDISMDISIDVQSDSNMCSNYLVSAVPENKLTNCQTIHSSQLEYINSEKQSDNNMNVEYLEHQTIKIQSSIIAGSIPTEVALYQKNKNCDTIYDSADIEENSNSIKNIVKIEQEKLIHLPTDIIEESPITVKLQKSQNVIKMQPTICATEDIILESPKKKEPNNAFYTTIKTPTNMFQDVIDSETKHDLADIVVKDRNTINIPIDMVVDSPKPTILQISTFKSKTKSGDLRPRQTILTSEDIVEDFSKEIESKRIFQKTPQTPIDIFDNVEEETIPAQHAIYFSKPAQYPKHYDSFEGRMASNKNNILRESNPVDDCEEFPMSDQCQKTQTSFKGYKVRETILTAQDITEDSSIEIESKNLFQKTIKTPFNIFEDSLQTESAPKLVRNGQTINDSVKIEEVTANSHYAITPLKNNNQRKSICSPSDIIEENSKLNTESAEDFLILKASTSGLNDQKTSFILEDIVKDSTLKEIPEQRFHSTIKTSIDSFEDSLQLKSTSKSIGTNHQTIFDPADMDMDEVEVTIEHKINKPKESLFTPIDIIDHSPQSIQFEEVYSEPKAAVSGLKAHKTTAEYIDEDISNAIKSFKKTIDADFANYGGSLPANLSKSIIKSCGTIYSSSVIEGSSSSTKNENPSKRSNPPIESVYTPSDMLREFFNVPVQEAQSSLTNASTDLKKQQRNFNVEDITEVHPIEIQSGIVLGKTIKTPINKVNYSLPAESQSELVANVHHTFYDSLEMNNPIFNNRRETTYTSSDIISDELNATNPTKSNNEGCRADISFGLTKQSLDYHTNNDRMDVVVDDSKTDLEINKVKAKEEEKQRTKIKNLESQPYLNDYMKNPILVNPHKENVVLDQDYQKEKRQSIHTTVDMIEDSPKILQPVQSYTTNISNRKTIHESCNIIIDSPKSLNISETKHKQAIITQSHSVSITNAHFNESQDCDMTVENNSLLKDNNRRTDHTSLHMLEDSQNFKNHSDVKTIDQQIRAEFLNEVTSYVLPQSKLNINNTHKEFDVSMDKSMKKDAIQDTVPVDNSKVSMANETISNKRMQPTTSFNENFNEEDSKSQVNQKRDSTYQNNRKAIHFEKNINSEKSKMTKCYETPSKFDRSLAEYLKAEASAIRASLKTRSQVPKYHETPSKVDQSLAEYLKAEAAAIQSDSKETSMEEDEDEEIFYDAEDVRADEMLDTRKTCYMSVNILNESGIQSFQMNALKRQTTFSPKEMTNESIEYTKIKLAENRQKENRSKTSDNLMQTQVNGGPRKCLFQKSFDSTDVIEITALNDTRVNKPNECIQHLQSAIEKKQKYNEMEELEYSMDLSMNIGKSKKVSKPRDAIVHKTIHFSNENAVDESFFNEQKSNPIFEQYRQTLHINESIQTAEASPTWKKPSSAVQSVRKMLLENTRLLSQSYLLKPSLFEKQKPTIYFPENNNSMEISYMDSTPNDTECTPSKRKMSRIPQLIDSAKKLESMKKSIHFIQQKLPNLGCGLIKTNEFGDIPNLSNEQKDKPTERVVQKTQESFKKNDFSQKAIVFKPNQLNKSFDKTEISRIAMSKETEKSYQGVVRKLGESFDTIEIPRKVLSSVKNAVEKSPLDVDKTHRSITNIEQRVPPESFDIVDIPRRATTFERNDITFAFPNEMEMTKNASLKSWFQLEDVPITISDVSTYFPQKVLPTAIQATGTYSPNSTEPLCKLNIKDFQELSGSSDSEDTMHNLAKFKKRYVDLTCDSILLSDLKGDIEKTHLSLINMLDDESEMVQCQPEIDIPPSIENEISPFAEEPLKPIASVCRKCKRNRLSATQNDTSIESFMLEPLPVYKMDLDALQQLENKPKLADVANFWQQQIRKSDSFNVSDGSRIMTLNDEESLDSFISKLQNERLVNAKHRKQKRNETKMETSFLHKVYKKIQSKPDWTVNTLLLGNNVLKLTHARIRTFTIFMDFKPKDLKGMKGDFNEVQLVPNKLHNCQSKPFEYALHYQLLVELPFDLKKICPTSEHFFEFLEHVENVLQDVLRTCKNMLSLTLSSPACLIRDPSGSLYIRKYVRTKTSQHEVKRTEIHIEVRNIKQLSYESIIMPPLYEFDEKIKLLPVGHNFLKIFLDDPLKFMKS